MWSRILAGQHLALGLRGRTRFDALQILLTERHLQASAAAQSWKVHNYIGAAAALCSPSAGWAPGSSSLEAEELHSCTFLRLSCVCLGGEHSAVLLLDKCSSHIACSGYSHRATSGEAILSELVRVLWEASEDGVLVCEDSAEPSHWALWVNSLHWELWSPCRAAAYDWTETTSLLIWEKKLKP